LSISNQIYFKTSGNSLSQFLSFHFTDSVY